MFATSLAYLAAVTLRSRRRRRAGCLGRREGGREVGRERGRGCDTEEDKEEADPQEGGTTV